MSAETLTEAAVEMASSLAQHGFPVIVLVSAHGGNARALRAAVARLQPPLIDAVVLALRATSGPHPGSHSRAWLTSVMLALEPDLVDLVNATDDLAPEVRDADARQGADHLERFVASIVSQVRSAAAHR